MEDINKKLKQVRKHLKMTQQEMADLLGCKQPMIAKIEKGEKDLTPEHIKILHIRKNINPSFFFNSSEPLEYKKTDSLMTSVRELKSELEISKAQIKYLFSLQEAKKTE